MVFFKRQVTYLWHHRLVRCYWLLDYRNNLRRILLLRWFGQAGRNSNLHISKAWIPLSCWCLMLLWHLYRGENLTSDINGFSVCSNSMCVTTLLCRFCSFNNLSCHILLPWSRIPQSRTYSKSRSQKNTIYPESRYMYIKVLPQTKNSMTLLDFTKLVDTTLKVNASILSCRKVPQREWLF